MKQVYQGTPELALVMSLPRVGDIPGAVIVAEIGSVDGSRAPATSASYAGMTPRAHASGGKVRYGPLRPDVNRYLKWVFIETANVPCMNRRLHPDRHVSRLYTRLTPRKGHQRAIGAVARHLAEATYWILNKRQPYCDEARGAFVHEAVGT